MFLSRTATCLVGVTILSVVSSQTAPGRAESAGLANTPLPVVVVDGPEVARSAQAFTDSVGVGVHWGYSDTPYGADYERVRALLVASGVKHVRGDATRAADLSARGIKSLVLVDSAMDGTGS